MAFNFIDVLRTASEAESLFFFVLLLRPIPIRIFIRLALSEHAATLAKVYRAGLGLLLLGFPGPTRQSSRSAHATACSVSSNASQRLFMLLLFLIFGSLLILLLCLDGSVD